MVSVTNNVVCDAETYRISNILRKQSFSDYKHETSDRTLEMWLSLMVRYVESTTLSVRVELIQLVNLDALDCSSQIFASFERVLSEKKIPLNNIRALACDNAQVMVGNKCSFKTKLKEKSPLLITLQYVSHSSAIAAKYSCATVPDVDDVIKELQKFLNASSKRTAIFQMII
ncbi:uncharacterized protein LOC117178680 [Belonocnema kinseyi]|uniref:uncharacterized protein LOC117178680 n=1 Tax=Belonocnema kinseyi TaxID=2817044 RepID=UPI00143CFC90|nr:uncharacterized protein LOC117178680 [Belonocnema kinseyi]